MGLPERCLAEIAGVKIPLWQLVRPEFHGCSGRNRSCPVALFMKAWAASYFKLTRYKRTCRIRYSVLAASPPMRLSKNLAPFNLMKSVPF